MSWRVPVAAAALVLVVSLSSGTLYRSATATAALRREVAATCATSVGLTIESVPGPGRRLDLAQSTSLDALGRSTTGTEAPFVVERSDSTPVAVAGRPTDITHVAVAVHRDGQEQIVSPHTAPLEGDAALVPSEWAAVMHINVGDQLALGPTGATSVHVRGLYDPIDASDPASPWCGQQALFAPSPFGDPPTPAVLVSSATVDALDDTVAVTSIWASTVAPDALREDTAHHLAATLASLPERWSGDDSDSTSHFFLRVHPGLLDRLATRADAAGEVVGRGVAPVQVEAVAASMAMLAGSGVLLALRRRAELELLVERGAPAFVVARRIALGALAAVTAGSAAGILVAVLGVRAFAPSPVVSPDALTTAVLLALATAVLGAALVTIVATARTLRAVDPSRSRSWLRFVPWELIPAAIAVVSWIRLRDAGGVHLSGTDVKGRDALAQAFPVLAIAAALALMVRPALLVFRRGRLAGKRLPVSVRLGVRRVTAEPYVAVLVVLAGAMAAATFVTAVTLRDTAAEASKRKAATFLGADLVVDTAGTNPLPASIASRATITTRLDAKSADASVDVLAIDRATFAAGATWFDGRGELDALLTELAPTADAPVPAIVVGGPLPSLDLKGPSLADMHVQPIAARNAFPGFHNGAILVVVDRAAVGASATTGAEQVWVQRPTPTTIAELQAAKLPVYSTLTPARVFDAVSFLVVEWSYAGMRAFGLVVGALVILTQLLVVTARQRQRQLGWLITRRMGLGARAHYTAIFVELAIPVASATLGGLITAVIATSPSARSLDAIANLQPPAAVVFDVGVLVAVAVAGVGVLSALAFVATRGLRRTNELEVVRAD